MILVIGEILYDLFPGYKRIGGAPFNFAFHLKHFGFDVHFVSRVGKDNLGDEVNRFLAAHGFDPLDIQLDDTYPTGTVEVSMLKDGSHTFSINRDTAYDRIVLNSHLKDLIDCLPDMIYFGSLIQRTPNGHNLIKSIINALPDQTRRFCDINLRPNCYSDKIVTYCMSTANTIKLSDEELDILVPIENNSLEDRAASLIKTPGPDLVMLTRGAKESVWVTEQGIVHPAAEQSRTLTIADTVGAGDAYAAMAAAAKLSGIEDRRAMGLAREFAGRICEIQGALPRDTQFYDPFIKRLSNEK